VGFNVLSRNDRGVIIVTQELLLLVDRSIPWEGDGVKVTLAVAELAVGVAEMLGRGNQGQAKENGQAKHDDSGWKR